MSDLLIVHTRDVNDWSNSALIACYRSGAVPGVYAYLAILMSEPEVLLGDPVQSWSKLQVGNRIRNSLGDDIELVLARKIRDQVRRLAENILEETDIMEKSDATNCEKTEETTTRAFQYAWMLSQLRVYLTSYSLLDGSLQNQPRLIMDGTENGITTFAPIDFEDPFPIV